MTYKDEVKIDIYSLHTEVANHSGIYQDYAEQYADSIAIMMKADEKVKVARADGKRKIDEKRAKLDLDIRMNPDSYDLDPGKKPTESAITNTIILHSEYKKAQDEAAQDIHAATEAYIDAVKEKELLDGVKLSFSHRKAMIEKECELFLAGYYADPKTPKAYQETQQEEVKKAIEETLKDGGATSRRRRRPVS